MTILQLRAVILTAELGSISAAAKELSVSQPNASNSIKLLEDEIGFPIFYRASGGTTLTKKGEVFLNHARQIVAENEKIMSIQRTEEVYRLRLGCLYFFPAVKAFLTLCEQHRDDAETDFRYSSVSVEEGIAELLRRNLDIIVAPVLRHQVAGLVSECKKNNISITSVCEIPAVLTIRKDHPAALDGRCLNLTQGSDALKEYPYVSYRNTYTDTSSTAYNDSDYIQSSYKIYVDEMDMKLRLISVTNAFSFGIRTTSPMMELYNIASFPIPGVSLEMFVLTRPGDDRRREITEFLELLRREVKPVQL